MDITGLLTLLPGVAVGGLIQLILVLAVIGLCLYLVERFIPMAEPIKILIRVIVVIVVILYLLGQLGLDVPGINLTT